jgi:predicted RNA methylase
MSNNIKPLREAVRKNNREKPNPVVKKSDVAKPPAAISNNKQSMKLYTEEQVRDAIKMAREGIRSEDNIIGSLNFINPPIELPSDDNVKKHIDYLISCRQNLIDNADNMPQHLLEGGCMAFESAIDNARELFLGGNE